MKFAKMIKGNKYSVEYTKPGDEISDFIGYLTVEATSPEDALQIAQEKRPNGFDFKIIDKFYEPVEYVTKDSQPVWDRRMDEYYWESIRSAEQPTTPKPTTTLPDNMTWAWDPKANQWIAVMKDNPVVTPPTYNPNNITNTSNYTTTTYTPIKSTLIDSLNQFLSGDKYSREIKIEKGLISDGLIKFAGINPIKGPKYSITDKGLNLLKQAAQEEYDFEKDYIKARKSYLLDGISESEFKTGAPESQGKMPKFSIFEKDGSELAQIEAKNSIDAKVKFIMENPEYEGSQTISVKKVNAKEYGLEEKENTYYKGYRINIFKNLEDDYSQFVIYAPDNKTINHEKMYKGYAKNVKDALNRVKNIVDGENGKEIDSKYSETTTQGLDFPNQPISPSTDIKVDTHGWVNQAADDNVDKKQTFLKTLVYQQNKKNGDESSVGLNLDFDNKAVATGDLESLSEIETKLKDNGIACNITHREDFPEMYELTVFYNTKGAATDKFAALKKKASEPFKFKAPKDIFTTINNEFLVKLTSEKLGVELDISRFEFDYILNYELDSEINWGIDFETREYGIKNMRIYVPDQTISIRVEYIPHREEAPIKERKNITIECPLKNVESEIEQKYEYDSIGLKSIEIAEDYCKATF